MPQVRIPKEFERTRRKLVAIPETQYRRFRQFLHNEAEILADIRASEADIRAGRVVEASSIDEAIEKARARGWLDED